MTAPPDPSEFEDVAEFQGYLRAFRQADQAGDLEAALQHVSDAIATIRQMPDPDRSDGRTLYVLMRLQQRQCDLMNAIHQQTRVRAGVELNETEKAIVNACRPGPRKGEAIARSIERDYDYVRRLLAKLVRSGHLKNDQDGYRAM
jgi:hypothetical protein